MANAIRRATKADTGRKALAISMTSESPTRAAGYIRRQLRSAFACLDSAVRELSVALVGDEAMSRVHKQFMGIEGPTDVITFEHEHDDNGRPTAGELIICIDEARRQSRARGTALRDELLLYALHGLLHLSGFDDKTPAGFQAIHNKEDEILEKLGVGAVFHPSTHRTAAGRSRRGGGVGSRMGKAR
jgi:probable rRNA maturation factor